MYKVKLSFKITIASMRYCKKPDKPIKHTACYAVGFKFNLSISGYKVANVYLSLICYIVSIIVISFVKSSNHIIFSQHVDISCPCNQFYNFVIEIEKISLQEQGLRFRFPCLTIYLPADCL